MPTVLNGPRKALDKPDLVLDAAQQDGAEIRRHGAAVEVGAYGKTGNGWKTQLIWSKL